MVRQVALVPAGCQPWNLDVVASQQNRFAYSASLAIYIYEIDKHYNDYKLLSIMSEHKKTITSISWCPDKPNLLASASTDGTVIVWDVVKQNTVAKLLHKDPVMSLAWCFDGRSCLGFIGKKGPLWLWHFENGRNLSMVKESQSFSSVVMMFRWHHGKHNRLAFGHEDGSVSTIENGSKSYKHILKPEPLSDDEGEGDPVMALEWDPLSMDYLLVCNQIQGMRLVDVPKQETIMRFELPSAASRIQSMSWVHTAPGMFVTGDYKSGILRVWSASNSTPLENIKIKNVGFHRLEVISMESSQLSDQASAPIRPKSASKLSQSKCSLPNSQVVCTFIDGGVGLYDLARKKWNFLREQCHIETIFDCKFHPDNRDRLATASFDGTVKVWDITSMTCLHSSPGNQGIIYQISWGPADLECIVAGTSRDGAFIWDVNKGKIIRRLKNHAAKTSVYCVAWNQTDPRLIMSAGADHYCVIQQADGQAVHRYKHPAAVFGCDWSPFNKDMLATGCEDNVVRIFYTTSSSDQPIKQLTGHEAKVFNVRWNPLKEGVLCSGSDDGTIRVWDYTKDQCTCVLKGHTAQVRGLAWNTEIASVLSSGSWDCTIRVWDTQDGACLHTIHDHGADVYGLTSHPSRPFLLASSSRDSTVRLWTITSLFQTIKLNILLGKSDDIAGGDFCHAHSIPCALSGRVSKNLTAKYLHSGKNYSKGLEEFSKFFTHPCGTTNLWDLVSVLSGKDSLLLSQSYKSGIVHMSHLTQFKWSQAQQLQMVKMSKFGEGIGAPTKEERMMEAANIYIKLGRVEQYCEILVDIGEWERALAVAPSVSLDYWHRLNDRYSSLLLSVDSEAAIPFCVASGATSDLVTFLTSRGQLSDAIVVAQSANEGAITRPKTKAGKKTMERTEDKHNECLVTEVMNNLSAFHFRRGSPILSACCHLAVNDINGAMSKLIRSNELDLAFSIGQVLCQTSPELDVVLELLARRCENLGRWDLGLDFLSMLQEPHSAQAKLCMRCSSSLGELNALHLKAGLPSLDSCAEKGRQLDDSTSHVLECIKYYLLSMESERGLDKGLALIKYKIGSSDWKADDVLDVLQLLGCVKTEKLQHSKNTELMYELLTLSAYVGALLAIRRQYNSIVEPLFQHAQSLYKKGGLDLPFSVAEIHQDCEAWCNYNTQSASPDHETRLKSLLYRCGQAGDWPIEPGVECVANSHLPSHSDIHVSVLSGTRIQGPSYLLEDGKSYISLNEALMWAKVNPFSPLGSGHRINPF